MLLVTVLQTKCAKRCWEQAVGIMILMWERGKLSADVFGTGEVFPRLSNEDTEIPKVMSVLDCYVKTIVYFIYIWCRPDTLALAVLCSGVIIEALSYWATRTFLYNLIYCKICVSMGWVCDNEDNMEQLQWWDWSGAPPCGTMWEITL